MSRGRGNRRGRSASTVSANVADGSKQLCGTCDSDVGDEAIGCDECETWVHNTEMCSGLTQDMIDAIGRYQGSGIKFVCMKCRITHTAARGKSPSSSTEPHLAELVGQLFQQVKGISNVVQDLISQVKTLSAQRQPVSVQPAQQPGATTPAPTPTYASIVTSASGPPTSSVEYRTMVREELRELEEQRKRRSSLVIRGLEASSAQGAVRRFEEVTEHLIQQKVTLVEVVRIPSETDLYRGKVPDDSVRKLILEKAKVLKNSTQFGSVFIRRDLTYNQRKELRARRSVTESNTRVGNDAHDHNSRQRLLEPHPTSVPDVPEQETDTIPKSVMAPHTQSSHAPN